MRDLLRSFQFTTCLVVVAIAVAAVAASNTDESSQGATETTVEQTALAKRK
jgi:hypothetical protein